MVGSIFDTLTVCISCTYTFRFPKVSEKMASALENQLDKKTRWELIQLIDQMNLECERISLESFISGFRVAMGIASEVSYEAKFLEKN